MYLDFSFRFHFTDKFSTFPMPTRLISSSLVAINREICGQFTNPTMARYGSSGHFTIRTIREGQRASVSCRFFPTGEFHCLWQPIVMHVHIPFMFAIYNLSLPTCGSLTSPERRYPKQCICMYVDLSCWWQKRSILVIFQNWVYTASYKFASSKYTAQFWNEFSLISSFDPSIFMATRQRKMIF